MVTSKFTLDQKSTDRTRINQDQHRNSRTVPEAQCAPTDISYLETEIHGCGQGMHESAWKVQSDQVHEGK